MKKKYIDRNIVTCTPAVCESTVLRIDDCDLCGYASLVNIMEVKEKGYITSNGLPLCIADSGYKRLVYLPDNQHWCLTAIYARGNQIIEWYFDITKNNFVDEDGVPCYDDLYLDIVLMPDGQIIVLDEDELKSALNSEKITQFEFYLAYGTYNELIKRNIINCNYLNQFCDRLFLVFNNKYNSPLT